MLRKSPELGAEGARAIEAFANRQEEPKVSCRNAAMALLHSAIRALKIRLVAWILSNSAAVMGSSRCCFNERPQFLASVDAARLGSACTRAVLVASSAARFYGLRRATARDPWAEITNLDSIFR